MKKILYIINLCLILSLTSCSDFLKQDVRGQANLDTYFQNEDEAEQFIIGCYNTITFHEWWQIERFWMMTDMCTDDYWMGNTTQSQDAYLSLAHFQGIGQSNSTISSFWQYRYKGILKCNIAIERIPETKSQDKKKLDILTAEARFLRGFYYFELVKNFGGVPIIDGFLLPDEIQGITRSTEEKVYTLIEEDMKAAAEILPQRDEYSANNIGRATRGAALGILGKAYLYQGKFEEAKSTLKTIIDENKYSLMDDFGKVWNINYENNNESLFEVQNAYDPVYKLGGSLSIVCGNRTGGDQDGWAWGLPTANLEKAFIDAGDNVRLKWTIIKHGDSEIAGEPDFDKLVEKQGNLNGDGTYCIDPAKHKSARLNRKLYIPLNSRPENYDHRFVPLNHIILRYADILLMYAEACNETGDDGHAQEALNKVRARVGLKPITSTGNDLKEAIRLERRLELACEGHRLSDLRRWNDDNGKKAMCNIMGPNGTFVKWNTNPETADKFEWANQYESSNKGETFKEERDLLFPIPLYEITMSNGTIVQNPGWN